MRNYYVCNRIAQFRWAQKFTYISYPFWITIVPRGDSNRACYLGRRFRRGKGVGWKPTNKGWIARVPADIFLESFASLSNVSLANSDARSCVYSSELLPQVPQLCLYPFPPSLRFDIESSWSRRRRDLSAGSLHPNLDRRSLASWRRAEKWGRVGIYFRAPDILHRPRRRRRRRRLSAELARSRALLARAARSPRATARLIDSPSPAPPCGREKERERRSWMLIERRTGGKPMIEISSASRGCPLMAAEHAIDVILSLFSSSRFVSAACITEAQKRLHARDDGE